MAQPSIDLRFRNPYSWPIRIHASASRDTLSVKITGREMPAQTIALTSEALSESSPERLTRIVRRSGPVTGKTYIRAPGMQGCRVITYRVFYRSGREVKRERLSDDTYEAMNRVVQLTDSTD